MNCFCFNLFNKISGDLVKIISSSIIYLTKLMYESIFECIKDFFRSNLLYIYFIEDLIFVCLQYITVLFDAILNIYSQINIFACCNANLSF